MIPEILAIFFIFLLFLLVCSNLLSLPGNWIMILLLGLWKWTHPNMPGGWFFFVALIAIAGVGELLELGTQVWGARKYGGSRSGSWGALIGAILGAILGAPIFFGLGSLFGAVIGAFVGALGVELMQSRPMAEALVAAKGAMFGKVLGVVAKIGLGMFMLVMSLSRVWPG
jgi:uncharacterized protein YqgC (DUF456 family)